MGFAANCEITGGGCIQIAIDVVRTDCVGNFVLTVFIGDEVKAAVVVIFFPFIDIVAVQIAQGVG